MASNPNETPTDPAPEPANPWPTYVDVEDADPRHTADVLGEILWHADKQDPSERTWQYHIMSLAKFAYKAANGVPAFELLAEELDEIAPDHRREPMRELLHECEDAALRFGAVLGFALARTCTSFEELDGWLERAVRYADLPGYDFETMRRKRRPVR